MNPQVTQKVEEEVVKKMAENPDATLKMMCELYLKMPKSLAANMMKQWRDALNEQKDEAKRKHYAAQFDAWEKERNGQ
jgi:hypothetical protein